MDSGADHDALQGADRVNDELEVGYNERFEQRWVWAERAGRLFMILFVAAGLTGLFGRGPLSHHSRTVPGANLSVDYEPVTRVQTGTQVTLHVRNDSDSPVMKILVSTQLVEPMGLERILPQPAAESAEGDGMALTFEVPPGTKDGHIRLMLQPAGIGPVPLSAQIAGHPAVHWTQVTLP